MTYDGSGLWILTKRLDRGTYAAPCGEGQSLSLRPEDLTLLIHGIESTSRRAVAPGVKIFSFCDWTPVFPRVILGAGERESDDSGSVFKPGPELEELRQWVGDNPHWSRWRLSRELATRWDWRNGAGRSRTWPPARCW